MLGRQGYLPRYPIGVQSLLDVLVGYSWHRVCVQPNLKSHFPPKRGGKIVPDTHAIGRTGGGGRVPVASRHPRDTPAPPRFACRLRPIPSFAPVTHDTSGQPFGCQQVSGHLSDRLALGRLQGVGQLRLGHPDVDQVLQPAGIGVGQVDLNVT